MIPKPLETETKSLDRMGHPVRKNSTQARVEGRNNNFLQSFELTLAKYIYIWPSIGGSHGCSKLLVEVSPDPNTQARWLSI